MSRRARRSGLITAVKLYPAGATTNSHGGVRNMDKAMPVLERMAKIGLPLCVHGEVTTPDVDIFDREAVFIETVLDPLRQRLPELKVTMEHVTTSDGIDYIKSAKANLAGSITTHHLIINRNAILVGGIRPHYYCLPVAKRESHRLALRAAATSGDPRFFLGTDSAPHVDPLKECACRLRRHLHVGQHHELPGARLRTGRRAGQTRGLRLAERSGLVRACGE